MGDERRFTLLEMIREYALEQLVLSGEAERVRQAHADYFLTMSEIIDAKDKEAQRAERWRLFTIEQDNLRAALLWTLAHDATMGLYLAAALGDIWNEQGLFSETRQWLELMLAQVKPELSRGYAHATRRLGVCLWLQGDSLPAHSWLSESIARWRGLGDERELGIVLQFLALALYSRDEYQAALIPAQEAVVLLRTQQDIAWLAIALSALGNIQCAMEDYATARTVLEECLGLFQQQKDGWGVALALLGLADIPYVEGDYVTAHGCAEQALQIFRKIGERWFTAQTLWYLGRILWHQGEREQAIANWEESVAVGREIGAKEFVAGSLLLLGFAAQQIGATDQAQTYLCASLVSYQQMEHNAGRGYALSGLVGAMARCRGAQIDQCAEAVQILGAVANLLPSRGKSRYDIEQSHYARIVADIRAQIGEPSFAAAWAQGQTLSLDRCALAIADANCY
jgi:tetratricopeptide (TPR) repeat protein